jgi:diguanylate cyclase (GGDEF)-like protein
MSAEDRAEAQLALVLDSLGSMLHIYAQHAFDTDAQTSDDTRASVQHWRLHATNGSAAPNAGDERMSVGILERDWKGLLRFFSNTRRDEAVFVARAQTNLRESIWAFVGGLHQLVLEEHEEGKTAHEHICRVKEAVAGNDTESLKRETMAAVSVMETLMEKRRQRQQQQFSVLAEKLKSLGRELEDARREICLDALTGLPNRKAFDKYVSRSIELHTLIGKPAALLIVDVDNFKGINDTYGHPVGDEALRQVTRALSRTVLRRVDFVCRFGGDEFAIILQETDRIGALSLGEKLCKSLREVLEAPRGNEQRLEYTMSVGVAELALGDDALSWTHRADQAMYQAKRGGRNQVASLTKEEAEKVE